MKTPELKEWDYIPVELGLFELQEMFLAGELYTLDEIGDDFGLIEDEEALVSAFQWGGIYQRVKADQELAQMVYFLRNCSGEYRDSPNIEDIARFILDKYTKKEK